MKNEKFIFLFPLETERLIIRPTSIDDIELILKMDKQEETQKFLGGVKNKTREERIEFLQKKVDKFNEKIASSLTVFLKEDNVPIGFTGLSINEKDNNAELSYIYDKDYTGFGYCTEACKKLVEVSFNELDLNRIFADTIKENVASIKVLEKLGFIHEGTRRNQVFVKELNKYCDFLDFGFLKDDFLSDFNDLK